MLLGRLAIGHTAIHTHNDSYRLADISVVSTRRPFLAAGLMTGTATGLFAIAFSDLLYPGEIIAASAIGILAILVGLTLGRLTLVSRDLRGSRLSDTIIGTYRHLNRLRPLILDASERAKAEDRT